jgi:transposase InsO family protein
MRFACIHRYREEHRVGMMYRLLEVSRAGYYAWVSRETSERAQTDSSLLTKIKMVHGLSRQTYGSPRIHAALRRDGISISRKRVARLMRTGSVVVRIRRKFKATTNSKHKHPIARNMLRRRFRIKDIKTINRVWAGDITYIATNEGWLYLAVVIDLRSRRVVGWAMSHRIDEALTLNALRMAIIRRKPVGRLMYHSDRGSQYAAKAYRKLLRDHGIVCSMSRKGDCWDNAPIESFNATIKTELIHRTKWETREEVRAAVYTFIETWYNTKRLHSTLGHRSPAEFEGQEAA